MFSAWGVGILQAFLTRKPYLRRLAIIDDPALQAAQTAEERRAYARELAQDNPSLAREALIGRSGGFDEAGVVDINHAPVEDLADLPGIDADTARRIVAVRDGVGGFSSLEDLGMTMDLPGDVVERPPRPGRVPPALSSLRGMELIHTCYRIGEIDRSVAFYEALGFEERRRMPIREEAINVFMGLPGDGDRLELTYNHGVDSYELGTGYNHIALTVDDLDSTLEELGGQGIQPEKPPYRVHEGGSRICFVRDPDGYRVELIER